MVYVCMWKFCHTNSIFDAAPIKMVIAMAVDCILQTVDCRRKRQLWPTTMNKALCCEYTVRPTRTEIYWSRMKKKEEDEEKIVKEE